MIIGVDPIPPSPMTDLMRHVLPNASLIHGRPSGSATVRVMALVACFWSIQAVADGAASEPAGVVKQRCGWFDNPSPGNATLIDAHGEWTVAQQGGHQAAGTWPNLADARWVRTGTGSAGYGCACMKVRANEQTRQIDVIVTAASRPLSSCRTDAALKGKEPFNPLK